MYGKCFSSMYEGSMVGAGPVVFAVWGYCIAKADLDGTVLLNPQLLAPIIGTSRQKIEDAIHFLMEPDKHSKNPEHDGRRLLPQTGHLYLIVSHHIYREFKSNNDRREYMRKYMESKRKENVNINKVNKKLTELTPASSSAVTSSLAPEGGCKGGKFQKPTAEQVTEYGKSIGFDIDGNEFVDFYTSKGWLIGKNPMKDWQACVRTWKRKSATNPTAKPKFPKLQSHDMMSMTREQQDEYYRTGVKHYACELKPQVEQ